MEIEQFEAILNILEIRESSKSALIEAYRNAIQRAEDREGRIKSIRDQNAEHLQAEIDRLTAQNLHLRLICDRAMALVLTGEKPDLSKMTEGQIDAINVYIETANYNDLEEVESTEDMVSRLMARPLLKIACNSPDETNLLHLAIAEQNRLKLIDQEIDQLEAYARLKPEETSTQMRVDIAKLALRFAMRAGTIPKDDLLNVYSPVVIMSRESKATRLTRD